MPTPPDTPQPDPRPGAADDTAARPDFLVMGHIRRPHGVRGELKMAIHTASPDWLAEVETVYLGRATDDPDPHPYTLTGARPHRNDLLIQLEGVDDRDAADKLRSRYVLIRFDQAEPLADGEFYLFELLGMAVYTEAGEHLGEVQRVMVTGANDVFIVDGGARGLVLIPDTEEVVQTIDRATQRITIRPLPGLLPDDDAAVVVDPDDE